MCTGMRVFGDRLVDDESRGALHKTFTAVVQRHFCGLNEVTMSTTDVTYPVMMQFRPNDPAAFSNNLSSLPCCLKRMSRRLAHTFEKYWKPNWPYSVKTLWIFILSCQ